MSIPPRKMSLEEIEKALGYKVKLVPKKKTQIVNIPDGEVFQIGDVEFVVLKGGVKVLAITKDSIGEALFDQTSNSYEYSALSINPLLKDFENNLVKHVGQNNLIIRKIDLLSDNGFKDYDVATDAVAPMTLDEFRQFSTVLDRYKLNQNWWLATAHGTLNRNGSREVCYVTPDNMIEHAQCDTVMHIRPMICLQCSTVVGYDGDKFN